MSGIWGEIDKILFLAMDTQLPYIAEQSSAEGEISLPSRSRREEIGENRTRYKSVFFCFLGGKYNTNEYATVGAYSAYVTIVAHAS